MTPDTQVCIRKGELSTWTACQCDRCTQLTRRLHKLNRNGCLNRIPSEQGIAELQRMIEARMTHLSIATAVGVSPATVSGWLAKIRAGKPLHLGAVACQKIMAAGQPSDGLVGTLVAQRMLRALGRIGYSADDLTRRARARGITIGTNTLWTIRRGRTNRVNAKVANLVYELYRELHMTPSNSQPTIRIAIAEQWAGPLSWDNITDPNAKPLGMNKGRDHTGGFDDVAVERRLAGDRTVTLHKGETAEVVRRLLAARVSTRAINRDYGIKAERYQHVVGPRKQVAA